MAQRWQTSQSGAQPQKQPYFCDLCQKGYARMQDLERHENDYDHQHRKREKDRKALTRDVNAEAKAKAAERQASIKSISIIKSDTTRKPAVFKPIGQTAPVAQTAKALMGGGLDPSDPSTATPDNDPSGAVRNGWYNDRYDPKVITGCDSSCPVCQGSESVIRL